MSVYTIADLDLSTTDRASQNKRFSNSLVRYVRKVCRISDCNDFLLDKTVFVFT